MQYLSVVDDYLNDLVHLRGLSKSTQITYRSALRGYGNWLVSVGAAKDADALTYQIALTTDQIKKYVYHLSGRGLRPRSVRGPLHALRGLCKFLVESGAMDSNPVAVIRMPKKDAAKRPIVTDADVSALLAIPDRYRDKKKSALHKAVLATLVFGGLRAQEVCDIKVADIDVEAGILVVAQGKGNKARTLYPADECWDILKVWLAEREKMGCKHDYLFAQAVHKRVAYEGLREIIAEARGLAGLADELTAHTLRHNFACHLHKAGATIQEVQAALGHSTPHTTFLYLRLHEGDTTAMRRFGARTAINECPAVAVRSDAPPNQSFLRNDFVRVSCRH